MYNQIILLENIFAPSDGRLVEEIIQQIGFNFEFSNYQDSKIEIRFLFLCRI
jgi:hypothetical protein